MEIYNLSTHKNVIILKTSDMRRKPILVILIRSFNVLAPTYSKIIWLGNLLTLIVLLRLIFRYILIIYTYLPWKQRM